MTQDNASAPVPEKDPDSPRVVEYDVHVYGATDLSVASSVLTTAGLSWKRWPNDGTPQAKEQPNAGGVSLFLDGLAEPLCKAAVLYPGGVVYKYASPGDAISAVVAYVKEQRTAGHPDFARDRADANTSPGVTTG